MSLPIKAMHKTEFSKKHAELALEMEVHDRPVPDISLAEESGFDDIPAKTMLAPTARPVVPTAGYQAADTGFRAKTASIGRRASWRGFGGLALLLLGGSFYFYLETLLPPDVVVALPQPPSSSSTTTAELAAPIDAPADLPSAATIVDKTTDDKPKMQQELSSGKKLSLAAEPTSSPKNETVKVLRNRQIESATSAYQAFMAGDDTTAARLYSRLLQSDPRNVDALLGLAAIAARQESDDEAARNYVQVLALDPGNSIAQAGLIALMSETAPLAAVSRLKSLLAQQPDTAYLHAVLGGIYAEQNQWPDAQQSYFQAFRLDPGNAEYAFNLAIGLDRSGKPDLALDYYQRCLDLLPGQDSRVDRAGLESRINLLHLAQGK